MNNRRIIDYKTILVNDDDDIDIIVYHSIKEGWQPFGGICITYNVEAQYYVTCQAMVKYE